jgi:hypothetical protein
MKDQEDKEICTDETEVKPQKCHCSAIDSNSKPPEYKSDILQLETTSSMYSS